MGSPRSIWPISRSAAARPISSAGKVIEAAFLDRTADGDFLIYFIKAQSLEAAQEVSRRSQHPIDAYHQGFKADVWESAEVLERQIDFENLGALSDATE